MEGPYVTEVGENGPANQRKEFCPVFDIAH
jgi:hypothetical protein